MEIIGRIARVFSSSPIHARSQWKLAMVIIVPVARLRIKIEVIIGLIDKGGVLTNIFGVWAQELI